MDLEQHLARAKANMILHQPFYASLICALPLEIDDTLNPATAATNGKRIRVHPEFIAELSRDQLVFLLAHEVSHIALAHVYRRGKRDKVKWNKACDIVINEILLDEKIGSMPADGLRDRELCLKADYSADRVYDLMPDEPASQGGGGGKGDQWDDCEDAPGDEVEQHAAEAHAKVMVSQAAAGAEARGKLSKGLRKLVDEVLAPQVPWEDELRQFCSATLKVDTTWAKPSRRFVAQDLIMPSKTGEGMGEIVVGYDISGSISDKITARFNAEIKAMHADLRPSALHVIYFHHQVAHVRTFGPDDTLELGYAERGLTNFSPIFRRIEQENWNPDCCVVLTDLCCSDFGPEPTYPVLWASTLKKTAPWGRVLPVKA